MSAFDKTELYPFSIYYDCAEEAGITGSVVYHAFAHFAVYCEPEDVNLFSFYDNQLYLIQDPNSEYERADCYLDELFQLAHHLGVGYGEKPLVKHYLASAAGHLRRAGGDSTSSHIAQTLDACMKAVQSMEDLVGFWDTSRITSILDAVFQTRR